MATFDDNHPKIIELAFSFPESVPSVHFSETVNFRVPQPDWQNPFLTLPS